MWFHKKHISSSRVIMPLYITWLIRSVVVIKINDDAKHYLNQNETKREGKRMTSIN